MTDADITAGPWWAYPAIAGLALTLGVAAWIGLSIIIARRPPRRRR